MASKNISISTHFNRIDAGVLVLEAVIMLIGAAAAPSE